MRPSAPPGGKSKKDILRCLKRTITDVANAFGCGIAKISRIERGHIRDTRFLHEYRDWLTSQQPLRTAA